MKKQLTISLKKAREIYAKNDYTINYLLLETFSKEELECRKVKSWEDLGEIEGYYNDMSCTSRCEAKTTIRNRHVWATEEQAEACLAMSQLSQLVKHYNGDWQPDWEENGPGGTLKRCIQIEGNRIKKVEYYGFNCFLAFPTGKIRDKFLENHRDLIEIAKPLL